MYDRRGFLPTSEFYIGSEFGFQQPVFDGKYYQPGNEQEVSVRFEAVRPYVENRTKSGLLLLDQYQDWVELDWKKPHGSYEAFERFSEKLVREEMIESFQEFDALEISFPTSKKDENINRFTDELGDILWLTTALASNGNIRIEDATRHYFHKHYRLHKHTPPLNFAYVDYQLATGFNPTLGPLDDPNDLDDFEEYEPRVQIAGFLVAFKNLLDKQQGYNEYAFYDSTMNKEGEEAKQVLGPIILMLGYYSHKWGGVSLGEVAKTNMQKVSLRAAHGQIDKVDRTIR